MAVKIVSGEIVGSREFSFVGRDGDAVNMVQVFVQYEDARTSGFACASLSIPFKTYLDAGLCIGENLNMIFADKKWQYVSK